MQHFREKDCKNTYSYFTELVLIQKSLYNKRLETNFNVVIS